MSANIIRNTILFSIFTLALLNNLIAQTNYKMTVVEDNSSNQLSVYIESTSSEFELTSYQCSLGFNQDLISSNLEFTYIEGSSELVNEPNLYVGVDDVDGQKEFTFVSYVGNDIISNEKTLVGKFIIDGANSGLINTAWDFDGTISTIVTGEDFANITNASNHSSTDEIENDQLADDSVPSSYGLSQNYPNPFNPTTNVKVEMKAEGNASVKVYNLIGEEVLNVFEGDLLAGVHEMNINASNLPSGVYIYQLNVDNKYTDIKKMSLIK